MKAIILNEEELSFKDIFLSFYELKRNILDFIHEQYPNNKEKYFLLNPSAYINFLDSKEDLKKYPNLNFKDNSFAISFSFQIKYSNKKEEELLFKVLNTFEKN